MTDSVWLCPIHGVVSPTHPPGPDGTECQETTRQYVALAGVRDEAERLRAIVAEVTQVIETGWLPDGDSVGYHDTDEDDEGSRNPNVSTSDYAESLRDRALEKTAMDGTDG